MKNDNSLIPVEYLERAKKQRGITGNGAPIVVGVDPARSNDRTVITQGRVVHKFYKFEAMTNTQLAGYLTRIAEAINPSKIFIDYGYGVGTYDFTDNIITNCGQCWRNNDTRNTLIISKLV